jgi:hypothetical protein
MTQYRHICRELSARSITRLEHGKAYNEIKGNWYIDPVIDIPKHEGNLIFALPSYCLGSTNRILSNDRIPSFKPFANNLTEHFLLPTYPMEGHLLTDVHCIVIDSRSHTIDTLDTKLHRQYGRLPATEECIEKEEMDRISKDSGDQLLFLRERLYNLGLGMSKGLMSYKCITFPFNSTLSIGTHVSWMYSGMIIIRLFTSHHI